MDVYLRKTSLVDYPGRVAAALFFRGCNLRCPWCQNRELVSPGVGGEGFMPPEAALGHIKKRRSVLGGVVLSGGEPTLYRALGSLIREIRELGLPVKLDTNGMRADALAGILSGGAARPDYIALDLKLAPERYGELLGTAGKPGPEEPGETLRQSAALIRSSGVTHEFRSIVFPNRHFDLADVGALAPLVDDAPWYFRAFRPGNCLDPSWNDIGEPDSGEPAILARAARDRYGKQAKTG
ncbi:MAG: anaerobic ribonucleoside-triphosphate reductase activating protein [Spirochaetaceae bacterium]|jgi:pyruvate formate lyase activating enzyme|nr:anaerobic ribonucleoside-triphosphate reductase activating protein [Spirochaetaceae bacterium]